VADDNRYIMPVKVVDTGAVTTVRIANASEVRGPQGDQGDNGDDGAGGIGFQGVTAITVAGPTAIDAVADVGKTFSNTGATVKVGFTLPVDAPAGPISFVVTDADGMRITASAGKTIRLAGGGVSIAGGYVESTTIGSLLTLRRAGVTEWVAEWFGTWIVEDS
jgi:hypothetical protein